MPTVWLIAGLAVAAAGTATSIRTQDIAADKQKRAAAREARRQRAMALREARIRNAQIAQAAENTGVGMSSGAAGAAGSITSQLSGNLAFADQINKLQQGIIESNQQTGYANAATQIGGMMVNYGLKK